MFKFTKEELEKFLNGEAFYKSPDCFSLGKSFEEAGKIYQKLLKERDCANVGMACAESN